MKGFRTDAGMVRLGMTEGAASAVTYLRRSAISDRLFHFSLEIQRNRLCRELLGPTRAMPAFRKPLDRREHHEPYHFGRCNRDDGSKR
jgi:hypothetical protein